MNVRPNAIMLCDVMGWPGVDCRLGQGGSIGHLRNFGVKHSSQISLPTKTDLSGHKHGTRKYAVSKKDISRIFLS